LSEGLNGILSQAYICQEKQWSRKMSDDFEYVEPSLDSLQEDIDDLRNEIDSRNTIELEKRVNGIAIEVDALMIRCRRIEQRLNALENQARALPTKR